jgi:hypothetical protein
MPATDDGTAKDDGVEFEPIDIPKGNSTKAKEEIEQL